MMSNWPMKRVLAEGEGCVNEVQVELANGVSRIVSEEK